jgi:hypothetical protein
MFHLDISLKGIKLTAINFTQFARYFGRDSNRARSEYRSRSLPVYEPSRSELYLKLRVSSCLRNNKPIAAVRR